MNVGAKKGSYFGSMIFSSNFLVHSLLERDTKYTLHSARLLLPLTCVLACRSLASSSSMSLYLSPTALSRATCSARSLKFTCSNCQGPPFLGGIFEDGEGEGAGGGGGGGGKVGENKKTNPG
jgi:hypothetical protein